ncbi:MAG: hypothetical protein FWC69_06280 [Defluviitaleaceae bacterium]|nr:hypothetical protein [Defluviitaleaceae bacterium]
MKRFARVLTSAMAVAVIGASLMACGQNENETVAPYEPQTQDEAQDEPQPQLEERAQIEPSDDIFSFQFSLNDEVFALPFKYADLYNAGWVFMNNDVQLRPGQRSVSSDVINDDMTFGVSVGNLTEDNISRQDGHVVGITIRERNAGTGTQLVLPGGITIGNTLEEVLEAYGEPSETQAGVGFEALIYSLDLESQVIIQINLETELVNEIRIRNFTER